jgi:hypothetical protein
MILFLEAIEFIVETIVYLSIEFDSVFGERSIMFRFGNELPRSRADEVSIKIQLLKFEAELRGTNPIEIRYKEFSIIY